MRLTRTPDGYTILVISIAHSVNPWLYKLPYDPIKAFAPIGIMGTGTNVLTVHPSLPVNSLKEFLAMAKEKPGELSYASAGIGTFQHLGAELFRLDAKVNLLHVPFRGGGPALVDVLGGHNKVMFSSLVQAVPHIKSGRLRALGTGGKERVPALADVPTISEAGVPGYEALNWWGLLGAGRHARADHRAAAQGAGRGPGCAGDPGAVREGRRRHPQDELGGLRHVHRERDEKVGARGQGGWDQGGVTP